MGRVIALASFRRQARKEFRERNRHAITRFVRWFVDKNFPVGFADLTKRYQQELVRSSELVWDYEDWRDMLREAFERAFGAELRTDLARERWYKSAMLPASDVIDMCLTAYISGPDDPLSPEKLVV